MTKHVAALAAVVAALAASAPPASAGHMTARCSLVAYHDPTLLGEWTWYGVAAGSVAGNSGEAVAGRCVIRVSGGVRGARSVTPWNGGTTVAASAGEVTWFASPTETMTLCAQYTSAHGGGETCYPVTVTSSDYTVWVVTA